MSRRAICDGQTDIGAHLSVSIKKFPCRYRGHQCSKTSSTCCSYQMDKRQKPGHRPQRNALSGVGWRWIQKYFHPDFTRLPAHVVFTIFQLQSLKERLPNAFPPQKPESECLCIRLPVSDVPFISPSLLL